MKSKARALNLFLSGVAETDKLIVEYCNPCVPCLVNIIMLTMKLSWAVPRLLMLGHWLLLPHRSVSVKISAYFCSSSSRVICQQERYFHRSYHLHNLSTSGQCWWCPLTLLACISLIFVLFQISWQQPVSDLVQPAHLQPSAHWCFQCHC